MRRLLALCACFAFLTAVSAAEDVPAPVVVEPPDTVMPTMAPAEPAAKAAPAAAADGMAPAAASEPSPAPVFQEVSIANELIRVVITTQRGGIVRYELLNETPVTLPPALRERVDHDRAERDEPVPLLGNFIGSLTNPHWNLHNVLDFATESAANVDNTNHIPWEIVTADPTTATLRLRLPERGLQIEMIYTAIPGRPSVVVEMVLTNTSAEEQLLMPRLDPAIGGIFQDYPPAESYYLCGFQHQDGKIENLGVPEVGKSQILPLENVDYVGLKSRFFAALWQQDWNAAAPTATEQAVPAQGGLSGSAAVVQQVDAVAAATRSGNGVLFGLQRPGDNGPMVALRVDLPSAQLAAGATARYRWQITGSSMSKDALARLTEAEQRVKYTDGYYRFFKVLANALAFCLDMIAIVVRNYGVALIILTCLIKLALHRTTFKQQSSMLKMSKLAPEIKLLQERYKNDRQQLGLKTMELYKKHGVNPLGGCLPILIQMPMFMALYQVFTHSADFRNSGFLWISDLTLSDAIWGIDNPWLHWLTINPLALIYIGVTLWMSFQHKIPEGADPQQAQMQKMMRWLPLIFGVIFYHMPTGLVLYFTVNAILSTIEIKMVKRKLGMS